MAVIRLNGISKRYNICLEIGKRIRISERREFRQGNQGRCHCLAEKNSSNGNEGFKSAEFHEKKNEDVSSDTLTYRGSWPEETEIEVSGRSSCAGAVYRTEHLPYKIR